MDRKRPSSDRRLSYAETTSPKEAFMVPLLRDSIDCLLEQYAKLGNAGDLQRTVLDIGCGSQPYRSVLESCGFVYKGLDVAQNSAGLVDYVCGIDRELQSEICLDCLRGYDLILCLEVLEHVADWRKAFENMATLVAEKGLILITCPFFYFPHEEPFDYWRPTIHALEYYAKVNGFSIVSSQKVGDGWDVLGTLLASSEMIPTKETLMARMYSRLCDWCRERMYMAIRGTLRKYVCSPSLFYMSNIVVLEKNCK